VARQPARLLNMLYSFWNPMDCLDISLFLSKRSVATRDSFSAQFAAENGNSGIQSVNIREGNICRAKSDICQDISDRKRKLSRILLFLALRVRTGLYESF
jgi:hypothetical protein